MHVRLSSRSSFTDTVHDSMCYERARSRHFFAMRYVGRSGSNTMPTTGMHYWQFWLGSAKGPAANAPQPRSVGVLLAGSLQYVCFNVASGLLRNATPAPAAWLPSLWLP